MLNNILSKDKRHFWMGVAMLLVFLHHVFLYRDENGLFALLKVFLLNGDVGVNIFLFISAYGLCCSYSKNKLSSFYAHRLTRVFPLYWFFLLIGLLFFFEIPKSDWIRVFVFQSVGLGLFTDEIEWYVPALLLLYLSFPLIFNVHKRFIHKRVVFIIPFVLVLIEFAYSCRLQNPIPYFNMLLMRATAVSCGVITFFADNDKSLVMRYFAIVASFSIFSLERQCYFWLPLLLLVINYSGIKTPSTGLMVFLGKHSFEFYLAQQLSTKFLYSQMNGYIWLDVLFAFFLAVLISCALNCITKLTLKLIRQIVPNQYLIE